MYEDSTEAKKRECRNYFAERVEPCRVHTSVQDGVATLWADDAPHGIDLTREGARVLVAALMGGFPVTIGTGKGWGGMACRLEVDFPAPRSCRITIDVDCEESTVDMSGYEYTEMARELAADMGIEVVQGMHLVAPHEADDLPYTGASE